MQMKVTRAFLLAGERQEIGTLIDIESRADVAMLRHEGKAVPVEEGAADPSGPMTTETTGAVIAGTKPAKGKKTAD